MNELTPVKASEIAEAVLLRGDISQLKPEERAKYVVRLCESLGLNPMTRPIEFIMLSGRLTPYVKKDGTDQLRKLHGVSVTGLDAAEREGLYIVTAKVQDRDGRTDVATGALVIKGLQGEARANAVMKCETKAKRRATLSICGLGFLDESELDTIPDSAKRMARLPKKDARAIYTMLQADMARERTTDGLGEWWGAAQGRIRTLPEDWEDILRLQFEERMLAFQQQEMAEQPDEPQPPTDDTPQDGEGEAEQPPTPDDGLPDFLRRAPPPPQTQGREQLHAMAREAAERGRDVFSTFWGGRSTSERAIIQEIGLELRAALDRKPAAVAP